MKFSNEDFGMSMSSFPSSKTSILQEEKEPIPEDSLSLTCHIRFTKNGMWFTINQTRDVIADIMNGYKGWLLENMKIYEYSPFQMEGEECSIMYIYNVETKTWRLE
jgi:hypothetical protein